jgi:hypothetical protein
MHSRQQDRVLASTVTAILALIIALFLGTGPAWAAPAEEEYKLQIPSADGGNSASPGDVASGLGPGGTDPSFRAGTPTASAHAGSGHDGEGGGADGGGGLPMTGLVTPILGLLGAALAALGIGLRRASRSSGRSD